MSNDLVTLQGQKIRKGRVAPALRTAITLIVTEGLSIVDAAQRTGYKAHSLQVALKKPHVKAAKEAVKRAFLASETDKAWLTVVGLAQSAGSEDVKLKAAKVLLDAAGELEPKGVAPGAQRPTVIINMVHPAGHPIPHQLPGVIEAQPIQRVRVLPSNSTMVGREEWDQ
jgi:hypothetical protein